MHDIGPTARELAYSLQEIQPEHFEFTAEGEDEGGGETAWEASLQEGEGYESNYEAGAGELSYQSGELGHESLETEYATGYETGSEAGQYEVAMQESPLHESEEMEFAAELLEVASEEELDQFLGKLIRRVGRSVGRVIRSPIGRALGGMLKPLAKTVLPIAGGAVGTFFGGPAGGMIGSKLAGAAGQLFGLELEGLSAEDRDFEVARRVVRLAATATNNATTAPPNVDPRAVARTAVASAASAIAPGLPAARPPAAAAWGPRGAPYYGGAIPTGGRRRGIWVRRGRSIVLLGI